MINRRTFVASASGLGLAGLAPSLARAQQNVVRFMIPFSAGTTPDILARAIGPVLQERLGTTVVVENKAGASGIIGMKAVAQATDVNTLMIVPGTSVSLPFFYKDLDVDLQRSFRPITHLASNSFVLVVSNALPVNNFAEFVAWVKNNPDSFYASPDNGTHHHLFMELMLQSLGLKMKHAPYKRTGPAVVDLLAGQIPAMFLPIQAAVPLRDGGKLKILGSSLRNRHPGFPDIPALAELGVKDFHADPWFGVWGPPKMSVEQADRMRAALAYAIEQPAVSTTLGKQGMLMRTGSAADLNRQCKEEYDLWARVIKTANIKPQ